MSDTDSVASSAISAPPIQIHQSYNRTTEVTEPEKEKIKVSPPKPVENVTNDIPQAPPPKRNYKKYIIIGCLIMIMLLVTYLYLNPNKLKRETKEIVTEVPEKVETLPEPISDNVWDRPHHHFDPWFTVQVR